ncbi:protease modulator HflC [Pararhodospirillum oryzae]|uniref:Protein HflC n=1 Tax=Pararhodospirillum oryzae TaxID=478448 RepID=A0A512H937_9PROT|nr:protease modulator HflC [Pararhodospirillum oryzae]GEO81977.1 protein HflC [Pararhodospirillum oryzae]
MKKPVLVALIVLLVGAGIVAANSLFLVAQTQQAVVFQFGQYVRTIQEPGLQVKLPLIQNVIFYDRRVLELNPPAEQVILADQKRLVVDTYLRYRIADPLRFYQAVTNETQAASRLSDIVISALRRVLGNSTLAELLSPARARLMQEMKVAVDREARELGISVTDMRIRRADLPEETSQAIFARIRSEREREAREFRAQGQELAQQIRARADRERTVLLAEAQKRAQELRGDGDAQSIRIYASAFDADPSFFDFYRSLQAYRKALADGTTTLVLSPDGDFFRYFDHKEAASSR